uniref:Eosinophil peroxidase n=1 Tax=Panthera tigris altaica TaxID=74533 RepID=A0A8C9J924_PANTA
RKLFLALAGVLATLILAQPCEGTVPAFPRTVETSALWGCLTEVPLLVNATIRLRRWAWEGLASPMDVLFYFKQPLAATRTVVRAADCMHVTLGLLEEQLQLQGSSSFNVTGTVPLHGVRDCSGLRGQDAQLGVLGERGYRDGRCGTDQLSNMRFSYITRPKSLSWPRVKPGFKLPLGWAFTSHIVLFSSERLTSHQGLTLMFMQCGQFIDHDLDFTPEPPARVAFTVGVDCERTCTQLPPCFPINDPRIRDQSDWIPFFRSAPSCPPNRNQVQNQLSALTSFSDASMVYGSEVSLALQLCNQTNHLGLLAISTCFSDNGWARLPFDNLCDDPYLLTNPSLCAPCSPAGDCRPSETPKLAAMHTLFMREHTRWAMQLRRLTPPWSGDTLLQEARKTVEATVHVGNFLPLVLSEAQKTLGPYRGSCSNVDHRAASVFTLAFRFGHTMLQPFMFRLDSQYRASAPNSCVPLRTSFFASWRIVHEGDQVLRADGSGGGAKLSARRPGCLDELRDRLFCQVKRIGLDLVALDTQRSRDHTAASRVRGLPPRNLAQLSQVLQNPDLARKLLNLYGTPDNTDVWIGAIAEPLSPGAQVGPLLASLFENQFTRGERQWASTWHAMGAHPVNSSLPHEALSQVSWSGIAYDHTGIPTISRDIFRANTYPQGFVSCTASPSWIRQPGKANEASAGKGGGGGAPQTPGGGQASTSFPGPDG